MTVRRPLRALVLAATALAAVAAVGARPALAAWTLTRELVPTEPVAGQPAHLVVHTWLLTGPLDRPDLWEPLALPPDFPLDVRLYRPDEFHDSCAYPPGRPVALARAEGQTWRATVVFPEPGAWVVVFCNAYYPMALSSGGSPPDPRRRLDVRVQPAALPRTGGAAPRSALGALALAMIAGVAGLAVLRRTGPPRGNAPR